MSVLESFLNGREARRQQDAVDRMNEMQGFLAEQGGAIFSGDQNALAQFAAYDPMAALQIQGRQAAERRADEQLAMQGERLDMDRERFNAQIQQRAAQMDAEEAAAEAARVERAVQRALGAQTPEEFDSIVTEYGVTDLVGRFDDRQQIATGFLDIAEQLRMAAGPEPLSGPGKVQADINAGLLPEGTELRGSGTTINVGADQNPMPGLSRLGEGFTYLYNPDGTVQLDANGAPIAVAIPGGPADIEAQERAGEAASVSEAAQLAAADYDRKFGIVDSSLTEAISMLERGGRFVAGIGATTAGIPGSPARDFQAVIDTIKANLGFEELTAMREASPTGGALGQVSNQEINFLQAVQGNLDSAQSVDRLMEILVEMQQRRREFAEERRRILGGATEGGGQSSQDQTEIDRLLERYAQ